MKKHNLIKNKSKKYSNGSIWNSNSCGKFTIIGKTDRCNGKGSHIYCLCKFIDGTIVEASFTSINIGNVKNPNHPSVCEVGFIGQGKWASKFNGKTTKEYRAWLHMIRRCYDIKIQKCNPTYIGVTVDKRWHNFQTFCEDIQFLDGYTEWKNIDGYSIDKDILCEKLNIHPKIYSNKTCLFISKSDNTSESTSRKNLTGLTYIATSPSGETYEFKNQKEFAINNNLNSHLISSCIHKRRKHHKGWTFKIKE